jgi:DNA-binding CsgD family transcriptional regulator
LSFDDPKASSHFRKSRETASSDGDLRDALWGVALTSCQAETPSAADSVEPLLARRDRSPIDRVRATAAEIVLERISGSGRTIELSDALYAVDLIGDPRIRTSFMNACAYHLILRARYDEANEVAEEMKETADAYQLTWVRPHAHWALAAAALGRRQIAASNVWLRRVEQSADEGRFGPLLLNACCLRARQLLALRQPENAWLALTVDETLPANRGMRGEFYATKALTLAVLGEAAESRAWIGKARSLTRCVEARAYAACAEGILLWHASETPSSVLAAFDEVERTQMWDAFVSTIRACPQVLGALVEVKPPSPSLIAALRNAYDFDLSRQVGLNIGRRPHRAHPVVTLSRREEEVLDLIRQGFTNQDIARALFISQSTVKVHVGHILEKTGARSRAEAAARERPMEPPREPE